MPGSRDVQRRRASRVVVPDHPWRICASKRRHPCPDCVTSLVYARITLVAVANISAAMAAAWTVPLLIVSACRRIAAVGHFVLCYGPMPLGPGDAEMIANVGRA